MNVPYSSSGASSRVHYSLVRKVENAATLREAEDALKEEVQLLKRKFSLSSMSMSDLRTSLVVLLYCANASMGSISLNDIDFAVPGAVHLAEAGRTLPEKRMGYLFCTEVMPREHDMRLLLVNTTRKDLESMHIPRIILALKSLIAVPYIDVIPAVSGLVLDLASHSSPRVKTLAIRALLSLATVDNDILKQKRIVKTISSRVRDGDESVSAAAIEVSLLMTKSSSTLSLGLLKDCLQIMRHFTRERETRYSIGFQSKILQVLTVLADNQESVNTSDVLDTTLKLLLKAVQHRSNSLIMDIFQLWSRIPVRAIAEFLAQPSASDKEKKRAHPIQSIRHLLSSQSINEHFLFLTCLSLLNARLWAGPDVDTAPPNDKEDNLQSVQLPSVLNQWEVERIITFMDSNDQQIRILTLEVLVSVYKPIVEKSYENHLSRTRSLPHSTRGIVSSLIRLLEMADALGSSLDNDDERGCFSASKIRDVSNMGKSNSVSQGIVEYAVRTLRKERTKVTQSFISSWVMTITEDKDVLISSGEQPVSELDVPQKSQGHGMPPINWTLMLITVAFVCEHGHLLPHEGRVKVVTWLSTALVHYPVTMQEPMLLCMLRLLVLTESTPQFRSSISEQVKHLKGLDSSKSVSLNKYCDVLCKCLIDSTPFQHMLEGRVSLFIPELLVLLDRNQESLDVGPIPGGSSAALTASSLAHSQLRYAAYEKPSAVPKPRVNSFSTLSTSSRQSASQASSSKSRLLNNENIDMAKTITAGDLALAEGIEGGLQTVSLSRDEAKTPHTRTRKSDALSSADVGRITQKTELIALDSPFLSEPLGRTESSSSSQGGGSGATSYASLEPETNFGETWAVCDAAGQSSRGWLDAPIDSAVLRLQGLAMYMDVVPVDDMPFQGELKVTIKDILSGGENGGNIRIAAVRLRDGDDGSCLWQLRSTDDGLLQVVKKSLTD